MFIVTEYAALKVLITKIVVWQSFFDVHPFCCRAKQCQWDTGFYILFFTCAALAKAGLVNGQLRPSVRPSATLLDT